MLNRRRFLQSATTGVIGATAVGMLGAGEPKEDGTTIDNSGKGSQRLSLDTLRQWEAWKYGMFIHFGVSTFEVAEPKGKREQWRAYAPNQLDVDQWISVVRDSGMKYAVLTAKAGDGHCLWPSQHTDHSVANSANKIDVVEKFVQACEKREIKPGLYYNSSDTYHKFGSLPRNEAKRSFMKGFPESQDEELPPYTTSVYQTFMTAQVTELLRTYGSIGEMWIDIPGELGPGYRTFLYNRIAELQPDIYIMMNNGVPDSTRYDHHYAFPSDLLAIERGLPPEQGYQKWRRIEGKDYYMPGEVCDPIAKHWYWHPDDPPRGDDILLGIYESCTTHGASLLLDVPPDRHGVIPKEHIEALSRLRKNARI